MDKREPSLFDLFIQNRPNHSKKAPNINRFLAARRFNLDRSASIFMGELMKKDAFSIIQQHEFARPPYETTWVELDQLAYWETATGIKPAPDCDMKTGFLFDNDKVWVVAVDEESIKNGFGANIMPVVYHLHQPASFEQELQVANTCGLSRLGLRRCMIGTVGISDEMLTDMVQGRVLDDFSRSHRMELITDWFGSAIKSEKQWADIVTGAAGDLKLAIALCLFLTRPGQAIRQISDVARGHGLRRARRVVYFDHHAVTIKLERTKAVNHMSRILRNIEKRRHEVRGHWAQNKNKGKGCTHEWEPMNTERTKYICPKCGAKRWWKKHYMRGNASIGYVTKHYEVQR